MKISELPPAVEPELSRRQALRMALATSALLVLEGCGTLRRSDLDKARRDLLHTIAELAKDDEREDVLRSIGQRIADAAFELYDESEAFIERFDKQSKDRDISADQIQNTVNRFELRRVELRRNVLEAQDDLRRELTREEWAQAVQALNRKAKAVSPPLPGEE